MSEGVYSTNLHRDPGNRVCIFLVEFEFCDHLHSDTEFDFLIHVAGICTTKHERGLVRAFFSLSPFVSLGPLLLFSCLLLNRDTGILLGCEGLLLFVMGYSMYDVNWKHYGLQKPQYRRDLGYCSRDDLVEFLAYTCLVMLRYLIYQNPWLCCSCREEVISWSPRAFVMHNFLSDEECDYIKTLAKPQASMPRNNLWGADVGIVLGSKACVLPSICMCGFCLQMRPCM